MLASILALTAVMVVWAVWVDQRSGDCGTPPAQDCKLAGDLSNALYVWLIFTLWAIGFVVLAASWVVAAIATRTRRT